MDLVGALASQIPNWDQLSLAQRLGLAMVISGASSGATGPGAPGGQSRPTTGVTSTAPNMSTARTVSQPETTSLSTPPTPGLAAAAPSTAAPTTQSGPLLSSHGLTEPLPPSGGTRPTNRRSASSTASGRGASASRTPPVSSTPSSTTSTSTSTKRGGGKKRGPTEQTDAPARKRGRPKKNSKRIKVATPLVAVASDEEDASDEGHQDDYDGAEIDEPCEDVPRAAPTAPWAKHEVRTGDDDVRTWKPEPQAGRLVDGVARPEPGSRGFKSRNSAPPSPLKVFRSFLPQSLTAVIAAASTAYVHATTTPAQRRKMTTMFHDGVLSDAHILCFVAALFIMGEKKLPNKHMYWEKYHTDARLMVLFPTYGDFSFMARRLHFVDTSAISAAEQQARNKKDSFWKLGDFPAELSELFRHFRVPLSELTIDEFVIPFKGRHRSRMVNKDKPKKYHLKGFSLNEARTGYCLGFYMYRGAEEQRPPNVSASAWPIHALLSHYKELHHGNYRLFADNWFTGVGVVQDVASWGLDYTGTCRKDRVDGAFDDEDVRVVLVPDKRKNAKEGAMREKKEIKTWTAARGTARYRRRKYGDVTIYCTQWMDSKVVTMLSTTDCVQGKIERKVLENNKKNGKFSRVAFSAPSCFMNYNFGKVGTDRMDQNVSQLYPRNRFMWPVKVFAHITMMILNNAFISWREMQPAGTSVTLRGYLNLLLEDILSDLGLDPDCHSESVHAPYTVPYKSTGDGIAFGGKRTNSDRGKRGHCKRCDSMSRLMCATCKVWLCADRPDRKCWTQHHLNHKVD